MYQIKEFYCASSFVAKKITYGIVPEQQGQQ